MPERKVTQAPTGLPGQVDWVDELYDVVEVLTERVRRIEARLKKVERMARDNDLDLDYDEDDRLDDAE